MEKFSSKFFVKVFSQEAIDQLNDFCLNRLRRYKNICSPHISEVNAWSYALDYAINNSDNSDGQRWWFIEDDVAFTPEFNSVTDDFFRDFIDVDLLSMFCKAKSEIPDWPHWNRSVHLLDATNSRFSFNCFSMLKSELLKKIDEFINLNNQCLFHEILFSSVACLNNFNIQDLTTSKYNSYFLSFRYRPEVNSGKGVLHPVKNESDYKALSGY